MTTRTDSALFSLFSHVTRLRVYGVLLFILMVLGIINSAGALMRMSVLNFREPVYTQSSVSFSMMNSSTFSVYVFSFIFFIIMAITLLMIFSGEVHLSVILEFLGFGLMLFMAGSVVTLGVQNSVLSADVETKLVTSTLGDGYETVVSDSGNTYVDADDVAYKFVKTVEKTSVTWTLEKVK